jgi:hypothetical protein
MQPLSVMHDLSLSLPSKYLLVPRLGWEQGTIIIFCHLCLAVNILQFDIILNNEFIVLKSFIPIFDMAGMYLFFRIFGNSQKKIKINAERG